MTELPKKLRDAVLMMAMVPDVASVLDAVLRQFHIFSEDKQHDTLQNFTELLDPTLTAFDFEAQVQGLRQYSPEDFYRMLGFRDNHVPGMAYYLDPDQEFTTWTTAGKAYLADESNPREPATLWCHQIGGVYYLIFNMFVERRTFIADDCGVGKSCQAIGLISSRAAYIEEYKLNGRYPGQMSECSNLFQTRQPRPPCCARIWILSVLGMHLLRRSLILKRDCVPR